MLGIGQWFQLSLVHLGATLDILQDDCLTFRKVKLMKTYAFIQG